SAAIAISSWSIFLILPAILLASAVSCTSPKDILMLGASVAVLNLFTYSLSAISLRYFKSSSDMSTLSLSLDVTCTGFWLVPNWLKSKPLPISVSPDISNALLNLSTRFPPIVLPFFQPSEKSINSFDLTYVLSSASDLISADLAASLSLRLVIPLVIFTFIPGILFNKLSIPFAIVSICPSTVTAKSRNSVLIDAIGFLNTFPKKFTKAATIFHIATNTL